MTESTAGLPLVVRLEVERDSSPDGEVTIRGWVRNVSSDVIDPGIPSSELYVDGESSFAWRMAIGNGTFSERAYALPPDEAIDFARVFDASTFEGAHEMVLRVSGVESKPVRLPGDGS
jgi:hypothetical protein